MSKFSSKNKYKRTNGSGKLPLHPPKTSIPMTCVGEYGQQFGTGANFDLVFHVLYLPSSELLYSFVEIMANRLAVITSSDSILTVLPCVDPSKETGLDILLGAWILMMNVDMQMKQLIVNPSLLANQKAFGCRAAILRSLKPIDTEKAKRFFTDLSTTTIPQWLQNELLTPSDLVRRVKALYLNS